MPRRARTADTAETSVSKRKSGPFIAAVILLCVLVTLLMVYLGKQDGGEIDVSATIDTANAVRHQAGEPVEGNTATVPDTFRNMTNGGLVAQDPNAAPPTPEPEPVVSEATTTSTSTEPTTPKETENSEEPASEDVVTE